MKPRSIRWLNKVIRNREKQVPGIPFLFYSGYSNELMVEIEIDLRWWSDVNNRIHVILRNTSNTRICVPYIIFKKIHRYVQQGKSTFYPHPLPPIPGHHVCQSIPYAQWIPLPVQNEQPSIVWCDFFCTCIYHIYFIYYTCIVYTHTYIFFLLKISF